MPDAMDVSYLTEVFQAAQAWATTRFALLAEAEMSLRDPGTCPGPSYYAALQRHDQNEARLLDLVEAARRTPA